jgi:DMSO/TMAO reductase YedYZ molybdopterin-dependent catalytic subunit
VTEVRRRFSWYGAAAGVAAGVVLIAALVRGLLPGGLVIAAAIAERARGLLPLQVLGFIIVTFKFAAKPLGFWTSNVAVIGALGVLGGLLARQTVARAAVSFGILVAAGVGAIAGPSAWTYLSASLGGEGVAHPEAAAVRTIAVATVGYGLLSAFAYAIGLWLARGARGTERTAAPAQGRGLRRREFLARSMVMATAFTGASAALRWVRTAAAQTTAAAQSLFARVRGLPPEVTPNDKFYTISKNLAGLDPKLDARKWSLEIAGMVGKPVKLTYDDIKALPSISRYHTLECISNEVGGDLIGNAMWKGVRFRDLIERAGGLDPKAIRFAIRCADGYTEGIPVVDAMKPDTMVAYEMNGVTLPPSHGFPIRMLTPGLFGMKNPKWITKIEAVSTHFTGYWQAQGWSDEAVVKTTSQIRVPESARALPNGEVEMGGVAYSGDRKIQEVEYSTDNGKTWLKAAIKPALGPYTWVLWAAVWKPAGPGQYTLKVRAKDGHGVIQTSQEAPTLPDGASGYHTIRVTIRK